MRPIPVLFHIGPLQIHTYGIGLAITFWFAYRYLARRLRHHGYPDRWLGTAFIWIIVGAVVGARAVSVIGSWSEYSHHLIDVFAVWHGGLSSFGGMLGGIPVGFYCAWRWCRQLRLVIAADLVATVLVLAWSLGRLLGPQLMVAGGGWRTNAWYGMYYADQVGKRVPTPIFQAIECFVIWLIALQIEKFVARRGGPLGLVATGVVTLYGLSRFFDESVLLPHGSDGDKAVIAAALAFVAGGASLAAVLLIRDRRNRLAFASVVDVDGDGGGGGTAPDGLSGDPGRVGDPWAAPSSSPGRAADDEGRDEEDRAGGDSEGPEEPGELEPAPAPAPALSSRLPRGVGI